jgi:hypothetical protein
MLKRLQITGIEFLIKKQKRVNTADYQTWRIIMTHPNEVKLTQANLLQHLEEAQALGQQHVDALHDQMKRQGVTDATSPQK